MGSSVDKCSPPVSEVASHPQALAQSVCAVQCMCYVCDFEHIQSFPSLKEDSNLKQWSGLGLCLLSLPLEHSRGMMGDVGHKKSMQCKKDETEGGEVHLSSWFFNVISSNLWKVGIFLLMILNYLLCSSCSLMPFFWTSYAIFNITLWCVYVFSV